MSTTTSTTPATRSLQRRVLAAASIGQFVEFYDFATYGFVPETRGRDLLTGDVP